MTFCKDIKNMRDFEIKSNTYRSRTQGRHLRGLGGRRPPPPPKEKEKRKKKEKKKKREKREKKKKKERKKEGNYE